MPRGALLIGALLALVSLLVVMVKRPWLAPGAIIVGASIVPYPVSFVGKTPFGVVTTTGACLVVATAVLPGLRQRVLTKARQDPLMLSALVWVGVAVASSLISSSLRFTLNTTRTWLFAVPFAYYLGREVGRRYPRALRVALAVVAAVAGLAIVEFVFRVSPYSAMPRGLSFPLEGPQSSFRDGLVRARVGFYHASSLCRVLVVALPLMLAGGPRVRAVPRSWIIVVGLATLATLSFQAILGAAVSIVVLIAVSPRAKRTALLFVLGVGLVIASTSGPVNRLVESRVRPEGSSLDEYRFRAALFPASQAVAARSGVLGNGPGTFNLLAIKADVRGFGHVVLVDDNTFTAQLVEVGYPGLAAYLAMLSIAAAMLFRGRSRATWAAALAGLLGWILVSVTVDVLADDQSLAPVWLLIGLAVGSGLETNDDEDGGRDGAAKAMSDLSR